MSYLFCERDVLPKFEKIRKFVGKHIRWRSVLYFSRQLSVEHLWAAAYVTKYAVVNISLYSCVRRVTDINGNIISTNIAVVFIKI